MRRERNTKKYILSIVILSGAALVSLFRISSYFIGLNRAELNAEQLREAAGMKEDSSSDDRSRQMDDLADETQETEKAIPESIDFTALHDISNDAVAWIYAPDTCINYVIAQGEDNNYYLDHMLDGESSSSGTLFMDSYNAPDFTDWNTIIYGHHMKNGTMFAALEKYKEQEYYENHPEMYLYTPGGRYRLEILAAALVQATDEIYSIPGTEEDKEQILWHIQEKSYIKTNVTPEKGNRLVTLSTCSYDYTDARFVVVGRAVEE